MNCHERKAFNRKIESQQNWKEKAISRRYELEKAKSRIKELTENRDMWKEQCRIAQEKLKNISQSETKIQVQITNEEQIKHIMTCLCINLVINCSVSFRSVPNILTLINDVFKKLGLPFQFMIPHFTTVINWTLRVGKHLLKSALVPCQKPWICIIDHTIQIGSKKAFAVLKVLQEDIQSHGSLTLKNVEVLYLQVQEKSNGVIIETILEDIFKVVGYPIQMVMDGGSDLNKGVNLLASKMAHPFRIIYDLTHFIASLLKKKYTFCQKFNELMSLIANSKNKIRQTILAHLMPDNERSKSRFINLPSSAKWLGNMLSLLDSIPDETQEQTIEEEKILEHFEWLLDKSDFIEDFLLEMQIISEFQTLLKNTTLNEFSYQKALKILNKMKDSGLRIPLQEYLESAFEKAHNSSGSLLLFSDIIESLFGKYKFLAKPNGFSEINRLILLLPVICENITPELTQSAFQETKNKEVIEFTKEIGPSILAKRKSAFKKNQACKKQQKGEIISFSEQSKRPLGQYDFNGHEMPGVKPAML
jgi:hypothetical protein